MDLNRRTLLETVAGFLAAGQVLQAAEVRSAVLSTDQAQLQQHSFGSQRVYFEGATAGLKSLVVGSLVLNAGQEPHPPHRHADEEVLLITEGAGEVTMNGTASQVGAGAAMYAAPNYLHGIKNTGHSPLTFYYIKWIAHS